MMMKPDKKAFRSKTVTLSEAFDAFLLARTNLKEKTRYDYQRTMRVAFPEWQNKRLIEITKDMVATHHRRLGEKRGESYANLSMRVLRSVLNFAIVQYEEPDGTAPAG